MSNDLKGYYAKLGLTPAASDSDIKAVYRKLAKEHHPDSGNARDGGARFKAISEAYAVLSDRELRAAYDGQSATAEATAKDSSHKRIDPIACDNCGKVTAQPRFVVYRHVVSFVLGTIRTPVQGIFCADCARAKGLKATAISAVAGWWGVPWGPLYTFAEGVRNAFGGSSETSNNERLLWHNALAFGMNGQSRLSLALADKVRGAHDRDIAAGAAKLIEHFRAQGVELGTVVLKDPWVRSPAQVAAHLLMIAALPATLAGLVYAGSSHEPSGSASSLLPSPDALAPSQATDTSPSMAVADPPVAAPAVPTCTHRPENGKVLTGSRRLLAKGHVLEISNGSAGDSIVKLRNASNQRAFASFFIKNGESASLNGIPDGSYVIQYAFGQSLDLRCQSFTSLKSAGQFPQLETLTTERTEDDFGVTLRRMRLSYTLYSIPGGNVRPETIAANDFSAE